MKKKFRFYRKLLILLLLSVVAAFSFLPLDQRKDDISKAMWLLGTWINTTPRGENYETWKKVNDRELSGLNYYIRQRDTIIVESIRIVQNQNGLFYIPTVRRQNNEQPVIFTASHLTEGKMVFENPQHDFPQTISYTRIHADSLVAEISGLTNGQLKTIQYPMKRVRAIR
jgi:hypothetical protein